MSDSKLIRVRALELGLENRSLLRGLSFEIGPSERIALTGRSGLGKSVLLDAILCHAVKKSSLAVLNGELHVDARQIGYLPQRPWLPRWFNVKALVECSLKRAPKRRHNDLATLLDEMGVARLFSSYPRTLSGGEAQRVSLALALILARDLTVLDEPLSALDVVSRNEVVQAMLRYLEKHKVSVLLVSHEVDLLCSLVETIHILGQDGVMKTMVDNRGDIQNCREALMQTLNTSSSPVEARNDAHTTS